MLKTLKVGAVAAALAVSFQVFGAEGTPGTTTTNVAGMDMQWGATAGINMTTLKMTGVNWDSTMGYTAGAQTIFSLADVTPGLGLRTGLSYLQMNGEGKNTGITVKSETTYAEIPVTALYAFDDMWSMFGGLNLDLKLADKCTAGGADCTGVSYESLVYTFAIGPRVAFGQHTIEAGYEVGLKEVAKDDATGEKMKIDSFYGANYSYMF